jgi:ribonucleotide reductase beta subunit family protein with ferritin-like domain
MEEDQSETASKTESETKSEITNKLLEIFTLSQSLSSSDGERYSLFPIPPEDEEDYKYWKSQDAAQWFVEELNLKEDHVDFESLDPILKKLITRTFAFFANGDGVVGDVLSFRFLVESESKCEKNFYISQAQIEKIHEEFYNLYIELMITDENERRKLFHACDNFPPVQEKVKWISLAIQEPSRRISRAKLAAAELVYFSSLFCVIFYMRTLGKLSQLVAGNKLILKDELLHFRFGCHKSVQAGGLSQDEGESIIREVVETEMKFSLFILPDPYKDLTSDSIQQYVRYTGDLWLGKMGLKPVYGDKNPFEFMTQILLETHSNFFEVVTTEYERFSLKDSLNWKKRTSLITKGEDLYTGKVEF